MESYTYEKLKAFDEKFPGSVTWFRLKKHCEIVDQHLNDNEKVEFIFAGQLDNDHLSVLNTGVIAITNERLIVAQNRFFIGYKFLSITPDLYNDLTIDSGLLWGMITIDTVKEKIYVSNLSKAALPEIETQITTYMHEAKKEFYNAEDEEDH